MIKTELQSIQPDTNTFFGIYRGVVEDNSTDPNKSGRLKIRVFGVHSPLKVLNTEETEGIPTIELPWAEPALGIFEGSISGNGNWCIPLQGSHVFVFFENGHIQNPRYFASAPGIPTEEPNFVNGFNDPNGEYPKSELLNEPDFNRLARDEIRDENGDLNDTIVKSKTENLKTNIRTATGGSWDEPEPAYNAEYPHNTVIATHSNLVIEIDSTPGKERYQVYHPTNTYLEVDENGNIVTRVKGTTKTLIDQSKLLYVAGNEYETIGGSKDKHIYNDEVILIENNQKETISGSVTKSVGIDEKVTINGNNTINIGNKLKIDAGSSISLDSPFININCQGYPPGGASTTINTSNLFNRQTDDNGNSTIEFNENYNYQSNPIVINNLDGTYTTYNGGSSWYNISSNVYNSQSTLQNTDNHFNNMADYQQSYTNAATDLAGVPRITF